MPSKKRTTKPQPVVQSDYDTDTANVTDSTMLPPPARTDTELNLLVLRRYVPDIEAIICIAPFAVVYIFSPDTQVWEKSGVEGTLFVCRLAPADEERQEGAYTRYHVVVLNRKSLDNFTTELRSGDDIEITEQYVILQVAGDDGTPDIYGLWIFSDENDESLKSTREIVAGTILECAIRAEQGRESARNGMYGDATASSYSLDGTMSEEAEEDAVTPGPSSPTPLAGQQAGQQIDLMSLFGKPQASQSQPIPERGTPVTQHPTRFASTADTDFFRSSPGPAVIQQAQAPPQAPQNLLLDLFKSAKTG